MECTAMNQSWASHSQGFLERKTFRLCRKIKTIESQKSRKLREHRQSSAYSEGLAGWSQGMKEELQRARGGLGPES